MSSPIRTSKRKAAEVEAAASAEADVSVPIKEEEEKTAPSDPPVIKKPRKDIAAKAAAEDDKETEAAPDAGTDANKKGTEETDKAPEETAATSNKPEEDGTAAKAPPAADKAIKEEPVTVPATIYKEEDDFDEPDDGAEIVEDSDEVWNQNLFNLLLYKNQYKTLHVQATYDPTLHSWVDTQRKLYRRHRKDPKSVSPVTQKRLIALDSINFPFTLRGAAHWERYFNKLQDFHRKHGHCLVPRLCEFPGLGDWVIDQRRQYKLMMQGKPSVLDPERQRKLEQLGFVWVVRNRPEWNNRFQELLQYREKHGDTKVPQHYKEIPGLGKWVAKQREQFRLLSQGKHSFLTPDRLEKLNDAGFVWSVRRDEPESSPNSKDTKKKIKKEDDDEENPKEGESKEGTKADAKDDSKDENKEEAKPDEKKDDEAKTEEEQAKDSAMAAMDAMEIVKI